MASIKPLSKCGLPKNRIDSFAPSKRLVKPSFLALPLADALVTSNTYFPHKNVGRLKIACTEEEVLVPSSRAPLMHDTEQAATAAPVSLVVTGLERNKKWER